MYLTKLGTDSKKSNSQKRIGEKLAVGAGVSGVYGSPLCGQEEAVAAARRNQRLLFIEKGETIFQDSAILCGMS